MHERRSGVCRTWRWWQRHGVTALLLLAVAGTVALAFRGRKVLDYAALESPAHGVAAECKFGMVTLVGYCHNAGRWNAVVDNRTERRGKLVWFRHWTPRMARTPGLMSFTVEFWQLLALEGACLGAVGIARWRRGRTGALPDGPGNRRVSGPEESGRQSVEGAA